MAQVGPVVYGSQSQVDEDRVAERGGQIITNLRAAGVLVVNTNRSSLLAGLPGVTGVTRDRVHYRTPVEPAAIEQGAPGATGCASTTTSCANQWDLARIQVSSAWTQTRGDRSVKVAVLDTGLTSTHEEAGANYDQADSRSFVKPNSFCAADGATFASIEDFQGHWTNTHVAGVNGHSMTGIAPNTTLVNIRVLGACGSAPDRWVLAGMQ